MSHGLGYAEQTILRALLNKPRRPVPGLWFPLYSPVKSGDYLIRVSSQTPKGGFGRSLVDIDRQVEQSDNPYSLKSSLRRAAASLERKGYVARLICGASFLADDWTDAMRTVPLLCIRFPNEQALVEATALLKRLAETRRRQNEAQQFRERVRAKLIEQAKNKRQS